MILDIDKLEQYAGCFMWICIGILILSLCSLIIRLTLFGGFLW